MLPRISENISTHTVKAARIRANNFMNHVYTFLDSLEKQNGITFTPGSYTKEKVQAVYNQTRQQLYEINKKLVQGIHQNKHDSYELSSHEIKNINHLLKATQKEIAKVLSQAQVDVLVEASGSNEVSVRNKVANLSQGGLSAAIIRLLACIPFINTCFHRAVRAYIVGMNFMDQASKQPFDDRYWINDELNQEHQQEFEAFRKGKSQLERRSGVIGMDDLYRIKATFSPTAMHKQLDSFIAQKLSDQERKSISKDVKIRSNAKEEVFQSLNVPLNTDFSRRIANSKQVFFRISTNKGISAANRQEPHLINGWRSSLIKNGSFVFLAFRHGIIADKFEKNKTIREENARKAAKELLLAVLQQELHFRKMTIKQAVDQGIELNLNSVSLVTPDWVRAIGSGGADERTMLADQIRALKSFEGENQKISFQAHDGTKEGATYEIPVRVNVNTFNFGVNAGAVGKLKFAPGLTFGLALQYEENINALKGLEKQFNTLFKDHSMIHEAESLMNDIRLLMENKKAYLEGGNQYEIGAKIMILTNLMDEILKDNQQWGIHTSFNCMSGKDRTGIMDCMAKSFVAYAEMHQGHYPTHEELKSKNVQDELREIFISFLFESGNLEITELNTGAKGYKVESEAQLLGMPLEVFLNVQGLSATTSA